MAGDCWSWAVYFGETETSVCQLRDKLGFIIGLVSILAWSLAEVPQLVINAVEGSSEGLSEGLLWLWVVSDVLDVVGCSISDTLPTMRITAYMYFIFTVLLLLQHMYYTRIKQQASEQAGSEADLEARLSLLSPQGSEDEADMVAELFKAGPILLNRRGSSVQHTVYGSLRNLSIRRSSSSSSLSFSETGRRLHASFVNHHQSRRRHVLSQPRLHPCLPGDEVRPSTADAAVVASGHSSLPVSFTATAATSKMLAGLALVALLALVQVCHTFSIDNTRGLLGLPGRALLGIGTHTEATYFMGMSYAAWGSILGWTMAATFFIGRVPQVVKNWQRQSCAGLSVEMFLIVFTAAVTYCASILIRIRSWAVLLPCLPFFTDAAVGAVLDVVILCQLFLYKNTDDECFSSLKSSRRDSNSSFTTKPPRLARTKVVCSSSSSIQKLGSYSSKLNQQQQQQHNVQSLSGLPDLLGGGCGPSDTSTCCSNHRDAAVPGSPAGQEGQHVSSSTDIFVIDQEGTHVDDMSYGTSLTESVISIATV